MDDVWEQNQTGLTGHRSLRIKSDNSISEKFLIELANFRALAEETTSSLFEEPNYPDISS